MKTLIKNTLIAILFMSFIGCSDQYFDVNTPTGTASIDQLNMSDLLGPVIYHTVTAQYNAERVLGNYSQQFTGEGGGASGATSLSGTWLEIYLYVLPNLKTILSKAEAKNATHYTAVAKILTAINIGLSADCWDNIPYKEASQGAVNTKPVFDSQESIYVEILSLLDSAITGLQGSDNGFPLGNEDLFYGGNSSKWIKAAYTLKARYQLHLISRGMASANDVLSSLLNGFSSNEDDLQMSYTSRNINPWYSREILAAATGNDHDKVGDQLVSIMNGTTYPFATVTIDPRLPVFAEISDASGVWRGFESGGDGLSSDGNNGNTDFAAGGFYTNVTAPIVVVSYAEAQFIMAEAAFLANGGTPTSTGTNAAAYAAYINGIEASMNKLGVDGTAYMTDTSIDLGMGNLKLEHIMKEKYIANFLNPEVFNDLRRYDFSTNVFKGFALPVDNATSEFPGEWLVRAQYPDSEAIRNPDNVNANKQAPTVKVWWNN